MQRVKFIRETVSQLLGAAWVAVLLFLVLCFTAWRPLAPGTFAALALAGLLIAWVFERPRLRLVLQGQRLLLGSAVLTVLAICADGWALGLLHPERASLALPAQLGLLLCIAPIAVLLSDPRRMRATVAVFAALAVVHIAVLPMESITGQPFFTWGEDLYPRQSGPLAFQARGLAWQVVYFPGLLMSTFYLAAGLLGEERPGGWTFGPRSWLAASLVWAAALACLQSRSALAGALAASALGLFAFARARSAHVWLALAAVVAGGAALFWFLFSENKSGGGLRAAYVALYFRRALDPEWVWTGRGYTIDADPDMQVPGQQYLVHSHNDFAQVFFTWGLPALLAYLCFWAALVRMAWRSWRAGRYWPTLALVACAPSFLTDLGLHHLQKAAFLAVLAGMAAARAAGEPVPAPLRP